MNNGVRCARFSQRPVRPGALLGILLSAAIAVGSLSVWAPSAQARSASTSYASSTSYPIVFVHGING